MVPLFFWSVVRAKEDFVVRHVLSSLVSCTESESGRMRVQRAQQRETHRIPESAKLNDKTESF